MSRYHPLADSPPRQTDHLNQKSAEVDSGSSWVRRRERNPGVSTLTVKLAALMLLAGCSSINGERVPHQFVAKDKLSGLPIAGEPYRVVNEAGDEVGRGVTASDGSTEPVYAAPEAKLQFIQVIVPRSRPLTPK